MAWNNHRIPSEYDIDRTTMVSNSIQSVNPLLLTARRAVPSVSLPPSSLAGPSGSIFVQIEILRSCDSGNEFNSLADVAKSQSSVREDRLGSCRTEVGVRGGRGFLPAGLKAQLHATS